MKVSSIENIIAVTDVVNATRYFQKKEKEKREWLRM